MTEEETRSSGKGFGEGLATGGHFMEALVTRKSEERSGEFGFGPEKTPRGQVSEPGGSPSLIQNLRQELPVPMIPGVGAPG